MQVRGRVGTRLPVIEARAGGQAVGLSTLRGIARVQRGFGKVELLLDQGARCTSMAELELGLPVIEERAGGHALALSTLLAGLLGFDKVDQAAGGAV